MNGEPRPADTLERVLSLPVLVLYGLGTTVGAGIYALLGVVAGSAGMRAPLAFVAASVLASFTALSFCELSARMPRAGGEATYVHEALHRSALTRGVGVLIVIAGCVSAATVARGFAGYADGLVALPAAVWTVLLLGGLGTLAIWGISESALVAGALTLVEVGGLLWVIGVNADALGALPDRWPEMLPSADPAAWSGIGAATLLCFFAFLGFEDMVNVAEEVRSARRIMPIAILATLGSTVVLYLTLTMVATLAVPPAELAASGAPLALLYERGTGHTPHLYYLIGMLAMLNGALIQMIKAARLLYGLASQGQMPRFLAYVHPRTRTPSTATAIVIALTLVLTLALPIAPLAELTSTLTLVVFALSNLALWVIKRRDPAPTGVFTVPLAIPGLGFVVSLGFVLLEMTRRLASM
jgi:amino acid transporter